MFLRIASVSVLPNAGSTGPLHAPTARVSASAVTVITVRIIILPYSVETMIFVHAHGRVNGGKEEDIIAATVSKLNVVVLFDWWEEPEEADAPSGERAPLTRTLDKKEVEDEVAETLGKLGHEATLHVLDGSIKRLHALAKMDCDLIFNLAESFGGNDTADYCIAAYLELLGKRITGSGSHGLLYGQDKAVAKKILEFHGIHTPVFARSFRGRLDFSHDLEFPVIVKPAREDGSIGIEFNAVVSSIRELMERIDWLHANFDSPVLIEEYVEGREMYVGVIGNDNPRRCPSSSSICRSCQRGGRGSPAPR